MKTPTLKTERLILRPISLDDAPAIQHYFDDWDIIKYTQAPWPYPADGAERHLLDVTLPGNEDGAMVSWAIILKGEEAFDGFIGRIDYRVNNEEPDRGFWLAKPFHGRGLMSEAVAATQDYMFFEYGLERFIVKNTLSNIGSRRVKQKNGAVFLRLEEKFCAHLEEPSEVWEVTKESWEHFKKGS